MAIQIILIYLLGIIPAYGRINGSFYEIDERFIGDIRPWPVMPFYFLSWVAFIVGIIIFFVNNEKYFFKWSKKDLWKKYYENHLK